MTTGAGSDDRLRRAPRSDGLGRDLTMAADYVRIAGRVLFAHKLRSLLTVVSITIGAFSIVLMTSLADSGLNTIIKDVEDMGGARLLLITPDTPEKAKDKAHLAPGYFVEADRVALMAALPHLAESTWYAEVGEQPIGDDEGETVTVDVIAGDPGFLSAFGMKIAKGRSFSAEENRAGRHVCVVGSKVAADLFDGAAVGQRINILGTRCTIIGQTEKLARMGMNFGFDWDNFALLPLDAMRGLNEQGWRSAILVAKTDEVAHNDLVKRIANAVMSHRHNGVDDFEIWDFSGIMGQFQQIFLILKLIVGFVASISLFVGGVGVMNMMFVSITERTREIGIRKALGASPTAIQLQFLCEATFLSVLGGVIGVALGVAAAVVVNLGIAQLEDAWAGTVSVAAVVTALVVSIGIGVGFGFVPARRAAALDAVDAMRR